MNLSASSAGLVLSSADAGPTTAPRVEIEGLSLAYGRQPVLQGLQWQLHAGQVVGLLGRNGAGKTTLLEAMLGLRDTSAGSVRLFGQQPRRLHHCGQQNGSHHKPEQASSQRVGCRAGHCLETR